MASQKIQQALAVARQQGDPLLIAEAQIWFASVRCRLGQYPAAIELTNQALALLPESASETGIRLGCYANIVLGISACETDDLDNGEAYYRRANDLARLINDGQRLAVILHNLSGAIYAPRGQFAKSIAADQEAIRLNQKNGIPEQNWGALVMLGYVYRLTRQMEKALEAADELHRIAIPGSLAGGYDIVWHGWLALEAGDLAAAERCFAGARPIAENVGAPELYFELYLGLCRLAFLSGDLAAALAWAEEATNLVNHTGYVHYQGRGLIEQGRCKQQLGKPAEAGQDFRKAIALLTPLRLNFDRTRAMFYLAALLQQQGSPDAATAWIEAIQEIANNGFLFLLEQERALAYEWVALGLGSKDPAAASSARFALEALQKVPPLPLHISALGGLQVKIGARTLGAAQFRQRRGGELLGLLLLAQNHCMAFEEVAEALCPRQPFGSAQTVVHHATSTLRRLLEPDLPDKRFPSRYLEVEDGAIRLRLPPGSWLDIEAFRNYGLAKAWEAMIGLYAGDFLPEYRYADWAAEPREALAELFRQALLSQAEDCLARQEWQPALNYTRRHIAQEPWQERATEIAMRASAALGDIPGALKTYRKLSESLKKDLKIEPSDALQQLYYSLLKSRK